MLETEYQLEKARLAMNWRKSILDRLLLLELSTEGAVAQIDLDAARYEYEVAKLDYAYAASLLSC